MVTVEEARAAAVRVYERRHATWATEGPGAGPLLDLPLHPPTETTALAASQAVAAWIARWRETEAAFGPGRLEWAPRRWASMGTQVVPARLWLHEPAEVARFGRRLEAWRLASRRAAALLAALPESPEVVVTVQRKLSNAVGLDEDDAERLLGVLTWLQQFPDSGLFVRQLPVRGVHTKWIERHRSLVSSLIGAATGHPDLGLATRPELLRLRLLDGTRLAGVADLAAPLADVSRLEIRPARVVVVENLESMLALPPLPATVALHGQGYLARVLGRLPWVRAADVVYWGDLDTDGFNILSIARDKVPQTRSVLMDRATLTAHLDLCVPDPQPRRSFVGALTESELDAVAALREAGDVRLEQERIPWESAVASVRAALG
ncbi:Wadjet anti-phage system protein JetD domain-containing protein [Pseudactinotalea terrae]|uniref:Wadjet anti-phage system protein JetD domain-containing protein n=1 Tax=Pseudactinotalea terrae TaxID=1743262 RepID=UPI001F4FA7F0|nr:Wadjet anti-phage system protein JetD domain-containing protein [Pseudactinotalea terrae]